MSIYYVKNGGNDSLSGTSDSNAWSTITKVNTMMSSFQPGDQILFKRGSVWNDNLVINKSGTNTLHIKFGAYDIGNKPIITSEASLPSAWANTGSWTTTSYANVWKADLWNDLVLPTTVRRVWLNGQEYLYTPNLTQDNYDGTIGVNSTHRISCDTSQGRLYVYATSNPATFYSTMTCSGWVAPDGSVKQKYTVLLDNADYIDIDNLDLRGGLDCALRIIGSNYSGITNCEIGKYSQGIGTKIDTGSDYGSISYCNFDSMFRLWNTLDSATTGQIASKAIALENGAGNWDIHHNTTIDWTWGVAAIAWSDYCNYHKVYNNEFSAPSLTYGKGFQASGNSPYNEMHIDVYNNYMHDLRTWAVQINAAYINIYFNIIKDVTTSSNVHNLSSAAGPIQILTADMNIAPHHVNFFNNTIINANSDGLRNWAQNILYMNNLVINPILETGYCIRTYNTIGQNISNNIFNGSNISQTSLSFYHGSSEYTLSNFNTIDPTNIKNNSVIIGNSSSIVNSDFTIPSGSAAIKSGSDISSLLSSGFKNIQNKTIDLSNPEIGAMAFSGNIYYVKNGGNDSLSGTSDTNAWATIAKVNAMMSSFQPGDQILFKRGSIWAGTVLKITKSGTSSSRIIFGAYGTGNKPIITLRETISPTWTLYGTNKYTCTVPIATKAPIERMWFNGVEKEQAAGISDSQRIIAGTTTNTFTAYGVCEAWPFYHARTSNKLYVYSVGDPNTYYSSIEYQGGLLDSPARYHTVELIGADYITIMDMDTRGSGYSSIGLNGSSYCIFDGCSIGRDSSRAGLYANSPYTSSTSSNPASDYGEVKNCLIDSNWNYTLEIYTKSTPYGVVLTDGSSHWDIHHNTIVDWWFGVYSYWAPLGPSKTSQYHKIHHNDISAPRFSFAKGIQTYGCQTPDKTLSQSGYHEIYNNYIHDVKSCGYAIGCSDVKFYFNIIENVTVSECLEKASQSNSGIGIEILHEYGMNIDDNNYIFNNTFINLNREAIRYSKPYIYNNLFLENALYLSNGTVTIYQYDVTNTGGLKNNIFYRNGTTSSSKFLQSTGVAAYYSVNEINNVSPTDNLTGNIFPTVSNTNQIINTDFTLPAGSPAIRTGTDISSLLPAGFTNIEGKTILSSNPDIGASSSDTSAILVNPPSNLTATIVNNTSVSLTWTDASDNELGFKIEKYTGTGFAYLATTTNTSYTDSNLQDGNYSYRVYAYNGTISSGYSNIVNITISSGTSSIVINDPLQSSTVGTQVGGAFTTSGYKPGIGNNHILYTSNQITNGYLEFEFTGFSNSDVALGSQNSFIMLYDGRGITEPVSYNDIKYNFFRNIFEYNNESTPRLAADISSAIDISSRLTATKAVFTDALGNNNGVLDSADRDFADSFYAGNYTFSSSQWYKVKIEWNSTTINYYINGVLKIAAEIPYSYAPIDLRIWLGSGVYSYASSSSNITYRNFILVNNDNIITYNTPTITVQPSNQVSNEGDNVQFNITATLSGDGSIQYQWLKKLSGTSQYYVLVNNSKYGGVTTNSLSIASTVLDDGNYTYGCIVSNSLNIQDNNIHSQYATLTVNPSNVTTTTYGNNISFNTLATPIVIAPTNLETSVVNNNQVFLSWVDNSEGESEYVIQISTDNTVFTDLTSLGANEELYSTMQYTTNSLSNNTYYFRIKVSNNFNSVAYSNHVSIVVSYNEILNPPSNITAVASGNKVILSWTNDNPTITGVVIEKSYNNSGYQYLFTQTKTLTTYEDTNLEDGLYSYRFKSYRDQNYSLYSTPVSAFIENGKTVEWVPSGVNIRSNLATIKTPTPPFALYNKMMTTNKISIEMWIQNKTIANTGYLKRILTSSDSESNINFAVLQDGSSYRVALRGTLTTADAKPNNGDLDYLKTPAGTATTNLDHFVFTYNGSTLNIYINNILVATRAGYIGAFSNWNTSYLISVGDEINPTQDVYNWQGTIKLLAIYHSALTTGQINQNFVAGDV